MSWTDERVELLKKLWAEGLSASQIAGELGGVTRNAVIGKVHRLGLSGRAKTARPSTPRPRKPRAPNRTMRPRERVIGNTALKAEALPAEELAPRPEALPDVVVPMMKKLNIMQLNERTCKWPVGDPTTDDFHFCGCAAKPGLPYCEYHARIAYQPASNDRRRERRAAAG